MGTAGRRGAGGLAGGLGGFAQMAAKPPSARSWRLATVAHRTAPSGGAVRACTAASGELAAASHAGKAAVSVRNRDACRCRSYCRHRSERSLHR